MQYFERAGNAPVGHTGQKLVSARARVCQLLCEEENCISHYPRAQQRGKNICIFHSSEVEHKLTERERKREGGGEREGICFHL